METHHVKEEPEPYSLTRLVLSEPGHLITSGSVLAEISVRSPTVPTSIYMYIEYVPDICTACILYIFIRPQKTIKPKMTPTNNYVVYS